MDRQGNQETRVSPETFRHDRYLRASGYNFYVWAMVNLLVVLPLYAATTGRPWPRWWAGIFPFASIAMGIVISSLNDKRVEKMCGPVSAVPVVGAMRIWGPIVLVGAALTTIFVLRGPFAYVQPLWLVLVGCAYLQWGSFGVREFRWLGWTLMGSGVVAGLSIRPAEIPPGAASPIALSVWAIFMGFLWVPFGGLRQFPVPVSPLIRCE